jgi:hypothetical protein
MTHIGLGKADSPFSKDLGKKSIILNSNAITIVHTHMQTSNIFKIWYFSKLVLYTYHLEQIMSPVFFGGVCHSLTNNEIYEWEFDSLIIWLF